MATTRAPAPRFRRRDVPPRVVLTDDDATILWHVYRHRLIDSEQIYRLFPHRPRQHLSRRLNKLFQAHYLGRPAQQIELFRLGGGSEHLVYGLDREGARVLRDRFGVDVSVERWVQKNREIKRHSIEHTLATTRFMVSLEVALRDHSNIQLIPFDEILKAAPERTRKKPQPMRFRVPIEWQGRRSEEGIAPDAIFGLKYTERPAGENRAFCFVEIDRGTETVEPGESVQRSASFFRRSSILRKLVVYAHAHRARVHEAHFGIPVFRVLTVTTTPARVEAIQDTFDRHLRPRPLATRPGLFLFTDQISIAGHGDGLLSLPWRNAVGKEVYIDGR